MYNNSGYTPRQGDRPLLGQQRPAPIPQTPESTEPISKLEKDMRWTGVLLVRQSEQRTSSNGSKFLDLTLADKTGEINAKVWDGNAPVPEVGSLLKVRGSVIEWNGKLQLKIERMKEVQPEEVENMDSLVPSAPEKAEDLMAELELAVESIANKELRDIVTELIAQTGDKLLTFPAALKLHHAERSGLLYHTVSMLRIAETFIRLYPVLNADLLRAGVIAHDLAKISELECGKLGLVKEYTVEGQLIGHLVRGVVNIELAAKKVQAEGTACLLLQHMVLAHHGVAEFGSPKKPMFPEAEILNIIDNADARIDEMANTLIGIKGGAFSDRLWSLDRRLYKVELDDQKSEEVNA
ncbi:MAG: CMP-binding protein [Oscillospiraceae bacterium]|jgi:3'-5' exoribonuclease|nr:CMP-binding protein [Oscillospiraceae bacterium]